MFLLLLLLLLFLHNPTSSVPELMPEMTTGDDDDGCAIAGAGHTSQSTLLNLFLIASVLFSVVFLRRRV